MRFGLETEFTKINIWSVQGLYSQNDAIKRVLQLYPEGLSSHGLQYLLSEGIVIFFPGTRTPQRITHTQPMIEAIFEMVRRAEFPSRPSRMQSMFAWCSLTDARQFNMEGGGKGAIYEVSSDDAFVADQNLLFLGGSVIGAYELARKYWAAENSENQKLEAVIPLPQIIGNAI